MVLSGTTQTRLTGSGSPPTHSPLDADRRRVAPSAKVALSTQLEHWSMSDGPKTLGGLVDVFGSRSFAVLFVVLLGVPALPLPTGGATHGFELMAAILALELVAGRKHVVFGLLVIGGSAAAFLAPPFTGLDTLPARRRPAVARSPIRGLPTRLRRTARRGGRHRARRDPRCGGTPRHPDHPLISAAPRGTPLRTSAYYGSLRSATVRVCGCESRSSVRRPRGAAPLAREDGRGSPESSGGLAAGCRARSQ
jgi:hypothetical protein